MTTSNKRYVTPVPGSRLAREMKAITQAEYPEQILTRKEVKEGLLNHSGVLIKEEKRFLQPSKLRIDGFQLRDHADPHHAFIVVEGVGLLKEEHYLLSWSMYALLGHNSAPDRLFVEPSISVIGRTAERGGDNEVEDPEELVLDALTKALGFSDEPLSFQGRVVVGRLPFDLTPDSSLFGFEEDDDDEVDEDDELYCYYLDEGLNEVKRSLRQLQVLEQRTPFFHDENRAS